MPWDCFSILASTAATTTEYGTRTKSQAAHAAVLCIAAVRQCCRQQEWLRYEQSRTLLLAALDFIDSHNRAVASVLDRPTTQASSYPYRTFALLLRKPCLVSAVSTSACHSNVSSARPVGQGSAETETLRVPVYQVRWIALECSAVPYADRSTVLWCIPTMLCAAWKILWPVTVLLCGGGSAHTRSTTRGIRPASSRR